jgi:hypothetical protein
MMLSISLLYIAFIMLRYFPSVSSFFKVFIMKGCWIMSRHLLHLLRWSCDFCLYSAYVLFYVYWFAFVEQPFHPRNETNLIMVQDLFNVLLNSVCKYFIENFVSMFIKKTVLLFYFFVLSLAGFGIHRMSW